MLPPGALTKPVMIANPSCCIHKIKIYVNGLLAKLLVDSVMMTNCLEAKFHQEH